MIDTGATLGLGYTNQLEKAQSMVAHIEPSKRHKFRFGNGEQRESCSEVTVNFAGTGTLIKLQAVESPPGAAGTATDGVPILIGADWLDQEGATIKYGTKTMQLAKWPGIDIPLKGHKRHLYIDISGEDEQTAYAIRKARRRYPQTFQWQVDGDLTTTYQSMEDPYDSVFPMSVEFPQDSPSFVENPRYAKSSRRR
jgi:hypothetical protein